MLINFTAQIDVTADNFINAKSEIKFTKEGEEALLINMLLQSSQSTLVRCNNLRIKTIDIDSDDEIQERKRYKYSFSKFIDHHPELKKDKTFETDSIKTNSWYTRLDGLEVFPATDEKGKCFALIEGGVIYSFDREWCEEF